MAISLVDIKVQLECPSILTQSDGFESLIALLHTIKDGKQKKELIKFLWEQLRCGPKVVSEWISLILPSLINENLLSRNELLAECLVNSSKWTSPSSIIKLLFNSMDNLIACALTIFAEISKTWRLEFLNALKSLPLSKSYPCIIRFIMDDRITHAEKQDLALRILNGSSDKMIQILWYFHDCLSFETLLTARESARRNEILFSRIDLIPFEYFSTLKLNYANCLFPIGRLFRSANLNLIKSLLENETFPLSSILLPSSLTLYRRLSRWSTSPYLLTKIVPEGIVSKIKMLIDNLQNVEYANYNIEMEDDEDWIAYLNWIGSDDLRLKLFLENWLKRKVMKCGDEQMDILAILFPKLNDDNLEVFLQLLVRMAEESKFSADQHSLLFLLLLKRSSLRNKEVILKCFARLDVNRFMISNVFKTLFAIAQHPGENQYLAIELLGDVWSRHTELFDKLSYFCKINPALDNSTLQCVKISLIKRICRESHHGEQLIESLTEMIRSGGNFVSDAIDALEGLCSICAINPENAIKLIRFESLNELRAIKGNPLIAYCNFLSTASKQTSNDAFRLSCLTKLWMLTEDSDQKIRESAWFAISQSFDRLDLIEIFLKNIQMENSSLLLDHIEKCAINDGIDIELLSVFLRRIIFAEVEEFGRSIFKQASIIYNDFRDLIRTTQIGINATKRPTLTSFPIYPHIAKSIEPSKILPQTLDFLYKCLTMTNFTSRSLHERNWKDLALYFGSWKMIVETVFEELYDALDHKHDRKNISTHIEVRDRICDTMMRAVIQCKSAQANVTIALPYLADAVLRSKDSLSDKKWFSAIFNHLLTCAVGTCHSFASIIFKQNTVFESDYMPIARFAATLMLAFLSSEIEGDFLNARSQLLSLNLNSPIWLNEWINLLLNDDDSFLHTEAAVQMKLLLNIATPENRIHLSKYPKEDLCLLGAVLGYDSTIVNSLLENDYRSDPAQYSKILEKKEINSQDVKELFKNFDCLTSDYKETFFPKTMRKFKKEAGFESKVETLTRGLANYCLTCLPSKISKLPRNYDHLPESSYLKAVLERIRKVISQDREKKILICLLNSLISRKEGQFLPPLDWLFLYKPCQFVQKADELLLAFSIQQKDSVLFWKTMFTLDADIPLNFAQMIAINLRSLQYTLPTLQLKSILEILFTTAKKYDWDSVVLNGIKSIHDSSPLVSQIWSRKIPLVERIEYLKHPLIVLFENMKVPAHLVKENPILYIWILLKEYETVEIETIVSKIRTLSEEHRCAAFLVLIESFATFDDSARKSCITQLVNNFVTCNAQNDPVDKMLMLWYVFSTFCISYPLSSVLPITRCERNNPMKLWNRAKSQLYSNFTQMLDDCETDVRSVLHFLLHALKNLAIFTSDPKSEKILKKMIFFLMAKNPTESMRSLDKNNLWEILLLN